MVSRSGWRDVLLFVLLRVGFAGFVAVIACFFALPLLWLLTAPWDARASLAVRWPRFTLENFRQVFENPLAINGLVNSLILAGSTMLLVVLVALLAAYALSRAQVPGRHAMLYLLTLFSSVVTGTVAMVPTFLLVFRLGLIDQHLGVILVMTGGLLPTAIFILRDFIEGLPRSLEESARVAGARPWRVLFDIVVPITRPGLMVVGVWAFVGVWGNFLTPFILLRSPERLPAAVTAYAFFNEGGDPRLPLVAAYSFLYVLPVLGLYLWVNRAFGFRFFGGIKQ
jgi:multiple sugar transport system permease protein